jgi:translation elongation factor EF-Ts
MIFFAFFYVTGMSPQSIERVQSSVPGEESALVYQEFVANPEMLVGELLDKIGWKVKGFIRLECGES